MIYEPREDSFLLLESVKKYAKGNVLEIGTGSGILAFEASKLKDVDLVIAIDLNKKSVDYCKRKYKNIKNLIFLESNLFEIFNNKIHKKATCNCEQLAARSLQAPAPTLASEVNFGAVNRGFWRSQNQLLLKKNPKFNTIIFNPPYLPQDKGITDNTIYGGKKGYETIERFLKQVKVFLNEKGYILLLFSSLTIKKKVDELIKRYKFNFEQINNSKLDFEELYVYKIKYQAYLK